MTLGYSVDLKDVIKELSLEILYMPPRTVNITCRDINRPGLPLAGFFDHFEAQRIQIIGKVEHLYLLSLDEETRNVREREFYEKCPATVVYTAGIDIPSEAFTYAEEFGVPLLRTKQKTSDFMSALILSLARSLAPRITRHGVMVEIYGEGVLITGDSGIGKSETAIELVKRGHRLIADDAVEIKRVSDNALVASAPESIRHFVELRGIGIIDIRRIFGMGSVKLNEKIDLVIHLEAWNQNKNYDRFGFTIETTDIMGIKVPTYTIPVTPGRNLAVILEIAAMNHRQKKMGFNTAEELEKSLASSIVSDQD